MTAAAVLPRLLFVCGSVKGGRDGKPSATRSLLHAASSVLEKRYQNVATLDLGKCMVAPFDGTDPARLRDPGSIQAYRALSDADAILFGVPAYWGGPAGNFKNLIDIACGAAYDLPSRHTVLTGKPCALVVVGAERESARGGALQAAAIIAATGGTLVAPPMVVDDPRASSFDPSAAVAEIVVLTVALVRSFARTA